MLTQQSNDEEFSATFSTKKRLSNPTEFKAVFQAGKKLASRNFALYSKRNDLNYSRLGIVIAKRNVRKAVTRSLIKRILRESFRFNQTKLYGVDVIVVVYNAFTALSRERMRKMIDEQWEKLQKINHEDHTDTNYKALSKNS